MIDLDRLERSIARFSDAIARFRWVAFQTRKKTTGAVDDKDQKRKLYGKAAERALANQGKRESKQGPKQQAGQNEWAPKKSMKSKDERDALLLALDRFDQFDGKKVDENYLKGAAQTVRDFTRWYDTAGLMSIAKRLTGLEATGRKEAQQEIFNVITGKTKPTLDRAELGSPDATDNVAVPATEERILTARRDLTKPGDTRLVPEGLRQHLDSHQVEGVAKAIYGLNNHRAFLLADGTGVGKTRQQLAVAKAMADSGKKVLIVSKAAIMEPNWKKGTLGEAGSFKRDSEAMGVSLTLNNGAKDMQPGEVHATTYEALGKLTDKIDSNTVVIYDESHSLKNADSARSSAGADVSGRAGSVMYATASPIDTPAHTAYLFRTQLYGDGVSYEQFQKNLGLKGGKPDPAVGAAECYKRLAAAFDQLTEKGMMLKREISLKGVDVGIDEIKLPEESHKALADLEASLKQGGAGAADVLMQMRRAQEPHKIPYTVDWAEKELAEGRSVVVFCASVNQSEGGIGGTAGLLREALAKKGIHDVVELHGSSETSKSEAADHFQSGKARVIISTLESGGTGINLDDTVGDRPRSLVMMTPPFSGIENVQAPGRVWRLKSKSLPRVKYLFGDTKVDKWNRDILKDKMQNLEASVSGEMGKLNIFSEPRRRRRFKFSDAMFAMGKLFRSLWR